MKIHLLEVTRTTLMMLHSSLHLYLQSLYNIKTRFAKIIIKNDQKSKNNRYEIQSIVGGQKKKSHVTEMVNIH